MRQDVPPEDPNAIRPMPRYTHRMNWTDCPVIEVVPGRMSGAPVLRRSRVRPEDLLGNLDEGPEWMADAFGLPIEDVREVLAFYRKHQDELAPAL
jgi:uncharacterized protein (DUF433 family)